MPTCLTVVGREMDIVALSAAPAQYPFLYTLLHSWINYSSSPFVAPRTLVFCRCRLPMWIPSRYVAYCVSVKFALPVVVDFLPPQLARVRALQT